MKLATPLIPFGHNVDRCSRSSSLAMFSSRAEFERRPSPADSSSRLMDMAEREGDGQGERREKVYVAVGRSEDKTIALLQWTVRTFRSSELCLLHVHHPSPFIPFYLGKMPATQANGEVVSAFRRQEREKMKKLLLTYFNICSKAKVKVSIYVTEAEQVQKGLVDLVIKHEIQKLVMGSVPETCMKVKRSSSKATYAIKNAPAFCEIWFIYKGNHMWTREAFGEVTGDAKCNPDEQLSGRSRSGSLQYSRNERLYDPNHLHCNSSRVSMQSFGVMDCIQHEPTEEGLQLLHITGNSANLYDNGCARNSTSYDSTSISPGDRGMSSDSDYKLEEENLWHQLLGVKSDSEKLKNKAYLEFSKRQILEAEATQAIRKVKEIDSAYTHEAKVRKEAEDSLRSMVQEQEMLVEERLELTGELQKTMRNVAVLDSRVQEANCRSFEAAEELKLIQLSIASLRQEKLRLQKQKVEAELWLERWRSRRQVGSTNQYGHAGFFNTVPELVEFSLFDLQTATCNFSDSFKLNEGGYGCIYKGELLDRTVAIQRLPAHNIQGPSQFQKQVQILGKLRHPHLLNLIGACPEAWSLVYDYVPNGTLQCQLFYKSNVGPLSWKIRARIISEISTALLFLHTAHPVKIVHGNLNPENILLDSDLHCKICDFGISRLLPQETLCSSFRQCPEPQGAFPYTDPEYHRTRKLSPKYDLYSLGIVILQLLTGRPPVELVATVRKALSGGTLSSILDISAGHWGPFVAEKLADIALRFCEQNSRDRPELTPSLVKELQQLHTLEEMAVPSFFLCPILQEIMYDPQVAADGFTYEGDAVREWLENGRETSPMTNLKLDHLHLIPNHSLRLVIQEWICKC